MLISPLIAASSFLSPLPKLLLLPSWIAKPYSCLWLQVTRYSHHSIAAAQGGVMRTSHHTHPRWQMLLSICEAPHLSPLGNAASPPPVTRGPTTGLGGGEASTAPGWELLPSKEDCSSLDPRGPGCSCQPSPSPYLQLLTLTLFLHKHE